MAIRNIPLEPIAVDVRYGSRGPDKWTFQMEGVLDAAHDRHEHEFTIHGKRMRIVISSARRLPAWQCPWHPLINPNDHEYEWAEAWEFQGVGEGCEVVGIYSTRSRKGVFHFWPMGLRECDGCQRALRQFFGNPTNSVAMLALTRAMKHMARGSALGGYHVDCEPCWELFKQLRHSCSLS